MQIVTIGNDLVGVTIGNDLVGIEPPKSFRNAEDSVPYSALRENDKLKFVEQVKTAADHPVGGIFLCFCQTNDALDVGQATKGIICKLLHHQAILQFRCLQV